MADPNRLIKLGILTIGINVALMLIKIGVGVWGNSYALIADGIESASDIISSLVTWAGFHLSLRPPDENHPYGHGKIESLAGVFSGLSLLAAAVFIAYQAILEIHTPHHAPAWFTLPVLLAVVAVKWLLSRRVLAAGNDLESNALKGDAWHHLSDAITSAAVAIGITVALIGGKGYEMADDWAALIACLVIAVNGGNIVKHSLHDVLDGNVSKEIYNAVRSGAESIIGVQATEKCRIRRSGIGLFIDLHVMVDPLMTVEDSHRIGHEVKAFLMKQNTRILDVIIHIEPTQDSAVASAVKPS